MQNWEKCYLSLNLLNYLFKHYYIDLYIIIFIVYCLFVFVFFNKIVKYIEKHNQIILFFRIVLFNKTLMHANTENKQNIVYLI